MLYDDITIERFAEIRAQEQWEEGHRTGFAEGEDRVNKLYEMRLAQNRSDDVQREISNQEYRKKLFEEFGLIE